MAIQKRPLDAREDGVLILEVGEEQGSTRKLRDIMFSCLILKLFIDWNHFQTYYITLHSDIAHLDHVSFSQKLPKFYKPIPSFRCEELPALLTPSNILSQGIILLNTENRPFQLGLSEASLKE